jgi:hypothetical protein
MQDARHVVIEMDCSDMETLGRVEWRHASSDGGATWRRRHWTTRVALDERLADTPWVSTAADGTAWRLEPSGVEVYRRSRGGGRESLVGILPQRLRREPDGTLVPCGTP